MNRKITILSNIKSCNVDKLRAAFKEDPYSARILYTSTHFAINCYNEKLIKEEYIDGNGNLIPNKFRIYKKKYYHTITSDLEFKTNKYLIFEYGFKNGKFYKKEGKECPVYDFEKVATGPYEVGGVVSYDVKGFDNSRILNRVADFDELCMIDILVYRLVLTEWLKAFPWMLYMIEHNIVMGYSFNELYNNGITTLKKATSFQYSFPYPMSLKIHKSMEFYHYLKLDKYNDMKDSDNGDLVDSIVNFYFNHRLGEKVELKLSKMNSPKYNFFELYGRVLINRENFNLDWLYPNGEYEIIVWNVLKLAVLMDKKVDCKWSDSKVKDMNNKWSREYSALFHKNNNRDLLVSDVFIKFSEMFDIPYIKTLADLSYEGMKMNHCVGGYENTISQGSSCIYTLKDYTLQLNWGEFNCSTGLNKLKRSHGITIGHYTGFHNFEPSFELKKAIDDKIIAFNRYLLTLPIETYLDFKKNVENGLYRFREVYPEIANSLIDFGLGEPVVANNMNYQFDYEENLDVQVLGRIDRVEPVINWRAIEGRFDLENQIEEDVLSVYDELNDVIKSDSIDEQLDSGVEALLGDVDKNIELINQMEIHFGELENGDVISAEASDGSLINLEMVDGRLRLRNNREVAPSLIGELGGALVERYNDGVEAYPEVYDAEINYRKPIEDKFAMSFNETLNLVLEIHSNCFAAKDICHTRYDDAVKDLFDMLCESMMRDGFQVHKFVEDNLMLISDAVNSLDLVDDEQMSIIMNDVEHRLKLNHNPYYDLIESLSNEN